MTIDVDVDELTLRIAEAVMGMKRPDGFSARQALDQLAKMAPTEAKRFSASARVAAEYIGQQVNALYPGAVIIAEFQTEKIQ